VYLRSDFRFGPHDPTLWPQPYLDEYAHLGAIPSKPMDPQDPLVLMWWNPTRGDFLPLSGSAVDGIGQLRMARYSRLEEMKNELDTKIVTYYTNNPLHPLLNLLKTDLHNVLIRLVSLKTTFEQMVFSVTEFQRCFLETLGLLDYLTIYRPRRYGIGKASTTAKCVGVITNKPNIVQEFFNAGIPVWLCRPKMPGPFPHNVLDIVAPFEHASFLNLELADPPSVVYDGPLDDHKRHNAIHRFSRSSLMFKDPFAFKPSTSGASTSGASTNRAARQSHCKYISSLVKKQNKFLIPIFKLQSLSLPSLDETNLSLYKARSPHSRFLLGRRHSAPSTELFWSNLRVPSMHSRTPLSSSLPPKT
jgi:hypothetical protein